MKNKLLLLAICLLSIITVNGQNNIINSEKLNEKIKNWNKESVITIKYGENVFDKNHDLNITFKKIIKDKRHPKNINCKNSFAIVEIELMSVHSRPQTFQLATINQEKNPKMILFNGYEISLEKLLPRKKSDKKIKQENYSIVLKIKKHALKSNFRIKENHIKIKRQKAESKLLENHTPATSKFRIHPAEVKND